MKFILIFILVNLNLQANVKINSYRSNDWKDDWTKVVFDELDNPKNELLNRFIDEDDLEALDCPDYNYAGNDSKKDFWLVFLASLARAESGLNEKAKSPSMRGHRSYGLLQLAPDTAMNSCNLIFIDEEILDGSENLRCGVKLLNWQVMGAPVSTTKFKRIDLQNKLFGKRILLWGPLRSKDKRGRNTLYAFFKDHLDQLPFCNL